MKNIQIEIEVLNGTPLFVDHIRRDAFLKDPKHSVDYFKAVDAVENLQLQCIQIVTNTLLKYEVPPKNRWTIWQKERLLRLAKNGEPATVIASIFGVSEEAVMKVAGKIIAQKEQERQGRIYRALAEKYDKLAKELEC